MASIFTRSMIEAAVEEEYGETYIHWRYEFGKWLRAEADRIMEEELSALESRGEVRFL